MAIELIKQQIAATAPQLDAAQQSAVDHRGRPLVISGGPGTGKTTVLIEAALARIEQGQDPDSILIITYGRERASELRDAIALRTTQTMYEPLARTFHSLAYSIMKMKTGDGYHEPILLSGPEQERFIRDLLEGDVEDGYRMWPAELQDGEDKKGNPLLTSGFIRELRDLIMRANERGISPQELAKRGVNVGEKLWPAAADFWERYKEVMALREEGAADSKMRIDPSELMNVAIAHLRNNESLRAQLQGRFKTIMVDEFQESDPAQRELLRLISSPDLLLAVDSDSAVGRFRGADPDGLSIEVDRYLNDGALEINLNLAYRSAPAIFNLGKEIASQFKLTNKNRNRECAYKTETTNNLLISKLTSQSEEAAFIAYHFKRAHLMEGVPYSQMAVLLRSSGTQAAALRRAFAQVSIPVAGELETLANNPAIAPFILLAKVATGEIKLNLDTAERLLLSELGGADTISMRRMRTSLLATRDEETDKRSGTQMILDAIDKGDTPIEDGASLQRIHTLLRKARVVARKQGARAEDVLAVIWENAQSADNELLSQTWRKSALRGGNRGANADRDLDAMIQLFDTAARFSERFPYSKPSQFFDEISHESIAGDLITAQGVRPETVEILTVHSAKGRQWSFVAVAGLQEGVWPNLKQRSSLLGSERLVERERHGDLARKELDVIAAGALAEDERRLLHVALTRARERVLVTAVAREDDEPSHYFDEISDAAGGAQVITETPRPLTTSSLIATLRRQIHNYGTDSNQGKNAAELLSKLSAEGVYGADPLSWLGATPLSTDENVIPLDSQVPVSPSGAEMFTECGVKWFLEKSGGTNGDSSAQILGSAIHEFARIKVANPSISHEELVEKLSDSWSLIDQSQGWISATALSRAIKMLERFSRYHEDSKRTVVGAELDFSINVGRATIRGNVDRIEIDSEGSFYVIDFKTGKNEISNEKAKTNLQLACYQLAVVLDGFKEKLGGTASSGAELVYLAKDSVSVTTRKQPVIDLLEVQSKIEEIAVGMGAATFTATINKMCSKCVVKASCPIQINGRTVIS